MKDISHLVARRISVPVSDFERAAEEPEDLEFYLRTTRWRLGRLLVTVDPELPNSIFAQGMGLPPTHEELAVAAQRFLRTTDWRAIGTTDWRAIGEGEGNGQWFWIIRADEPEDAW